jgi:hypothetical protein
MEANEITEAIWSVGNGLIEFASEMAIKFSK